VDVITIEAAVLVSILSLLVMAYNVFASTRERRELKAERDGRNVKYQTQIFERLDQIRLDVTDIKDERIEDRKRMDEMLDQFRDLNSRVTDVERRITRVENCNKECRHRGNK
jgi:peptidoglycan hydrolase CwlO-like protein